MRIYYDLRRAPPTYDCVSFFCHQSLECDCELTIIPPPLDGTWKPRWWPHDAQACVPLARRIVEPIAWLHPRMKRVAVGPAPHLVRSWYGHRLLMKAFRRGLRPLRMEPAKMPRPYVTITLREAQHWPERNSNVPAWIEAAKIIRSDGLGVVIIRDTAKAHIPMLFADPEAAMNIKRRAALYAGAVRNMGVNNGPMWLAAAMDTPVTIFKPIAPGPVTTEEFFRNAGMEPGNPHPWGAAHQTVVWADDTIDTILSAYQLQESA